MNQIDRGTTPSITYTLPFPADRITAAVLTIKQNNGTVIEKNLTDMTMDGNAISVKLTQQETLILDSDIGVAIQLRLRDINDDAFRTEPQIVTVGMLLKDGVI